MNSKGENVPNYSRESLQKLSVLYSERELNNPAVIVDTNHANSGKSWEKTKKLILEIADIY